MRKTLGILGILCLWATVAQAQVPSVQPPITAVRLVISGGVAPITNDVPVGTLTSATGAICTPVAGTVPNPSAFIYKVNATDTTCWKYQDPGNGPLLSLPIGGTTYTSTLSYVNANGPGPASPVSNPFSRPGAMPTTAPAVLSVVP